jgi:hypothetical protein
MKREELGRIVIITVCISLIFVIVQELTGIELLSFHGIKAALSATTVLSIWWWFYFNYGWKVKFLNLILYRENINGTWFGTYESKDLKTDKIYTGQISLVIKQNYLATKVTSITNRYKSFSYSEELNNKDEKKQLIYVYSQDELSSSDHNTRKGTSDLELIISAEKTGLYGKFWTNAGSVGYLSVNKISSKHIMFFDKAKEMYKESGVV